MTNTQCIHRAGCPKPDICDKVGHCTSMTATDLEVQSNDPLAKAFKVLRSFNGAYDEYADEIEQMRAALVVAQRYLHERGFPVDHYVRLTVDRVLGDAAEPSAQCVCGDPSAPNVTHRTNGPCIQQGEPPTTHTTEDDFQHFLSYSQKRGVPYEADLRLAYYAGADAPIADSNVCQCGLVEAACAESCCAEPNPRYRRAVKSNPAQPICDLGNTNGCPRYPGCGCDERRAQRTGEQR
jgi:hypothetical protein